MSEKEEKNKKLAQHHTSAIPGVGELTEPSVASRQLFPNHDHDSSMPEQSKGEKRYNWVVYSGINYWLNLGISLVIADVLNHGKGRNALDWTIGKAAKGLTALKIPLEKAHHHSRVALETLALMSGGWLLLLPSTWLENHKRPVVHWLNKKIYHDKQLAPDGHEETPQEIYIEKEQPPQTAWNVIKRRLQATAAVVSTGLLLDYVVADRKDLKRSKYLLNPYDPKSEPIEHVTYLGGKERTTKFVVGKVNKGLNLITGRTDIGKEPGTWPQRYMALAALDTVFTEITALVMHFTNGAKPEKMPEELGDDKSPPAIDAAVKKPFAEIVETKARRSPDAIVARGQKENFVAAVQNQGASQEITLGS